MENQDKSELERKERNKKLFFLGLAGIVVFEFLRTYLGTFIAVVVFAVAAVLIFKNKAPEKFNEYAQLLGVKTKDLNKSESGNK